jgi:hypothetical protein
MKPAATASLATVVVLMIVASVVTYKVRPTVNGPLMVMEDRTLRCTNDRNGGRPWTRMEAEAAMLYARVAVETAGKYSGSPAHKQAWALESIAWSNLVRECWR